MRVRICWILMILIVLAGIAGCTTQGEKESTAEKPAESSEPVSLPETVVTTEQPDIPEEAEDAMPDFTVSTIDGGSFTLSEARREKDLILINLWATWCPPCRMEFPYLQEAYLQYQDRVAVIALSVEPTDTSDVLAEFAAEYGLTFPIANDGEADLATYFQVNAIPTSVLVDRSGRVVWQEVGAQTSAEAFAEIFENYLP